MSSFCFSWSVLFSVVSAPPVVGSLSSFFFLLFSSVVFSGGGWPAGHLAVSRPRFWLRRSAPSPRSPLPSSSAPLVLPVRQLQVHDDGLTAVVKLPCPDHVDVIPAYMTSCLFVFVLCFWSVLIAWMRSLQKARGVLFTWM